MYQYQAVEREQERDEYHAKILQLESLLKERDRNDGVTQRLTTEVSCVTFPYCISFTIIVSVMHALMSVYVGVSIANITVCCFLL